MKCEAVKTPKLPDRTIQCTPQLLEIQFLGLGACRFQAVVHLLVPVMSFPQASSIT